MKYKWLLFLIIPISAFADDLLMSNVPNGCSFGLNNDTYLWANFTPKQYQCNSGYYVPANNDGCVICPDVYDCNGGTFTFNEEYDQGNKFKVQVTENIRNGCKENFLRAYNNIANITATFTPIQTRTELYSGSNDSVTVNATFDAPMPTTDINGNELTPPTRPGYTFKGYYSAPTGGVKYYNADMTSAHVWDLVEEEEYN